MASTISKEERERYEKFIREHDPYPDDAPQVNRFDGQWLPDYDDDRAHATFLKQILELYDQGKMK